MQGKDWHLHGNWHHKAKQDSAQGKDWHPHGTWHRESNVDGAQGKELHQEAKQYSKQAKEDFRNCD